MNNLKTYFASPEKRRSNGTSQGDATTALVLSNSELVETAAVDKKVTDTTKENGTNLETEESSSPLYVIKKPSADSKLILQNMEEVLNSVKKKHRQKHRRKREQKKLAQQEAEAVAVAVAVKAKANQQFAAAMQQAVADDSNAPSKKPLREKTEQLVNGSVQATNASKSKQTPTKRSPLKSASPNETILKHFARTPKKGENTSVVDEKSKPSVGKTKAPSELNKVATKTNAFEVLMNARNKTIGSNTPGKELAIPDEEATTSTAASANVKRKLLLQEWSDRKGGGKRKLEEEERAAYVNKQLENRAKRFKKMLVTGTSPQKAETAKEHPKENVKQRKSKKKVLATSGTKDKEDEIEVDKPKLKRAVKQRLVSVDTSEELLPASNKTQDVDTVEFLAKLSSPTKKRDSLLGYFPKKDSPKLVAEKEVPSSQQKPVSSSTKKADDTPKRSRRTVAEKRTAVEQTVPSPSIELNPEEVTVTNANNTPSGRPRRSCAGKARYDYDLQESPTKLMTTKSIPSSTNDTSDDEETIIIDLDDSSSSKTPQQTPSKKLAPLFMRSVPKPNPDPALIKARQAFLMSGVPEKMRLEMAKQKQYEQSYEEALELFPKLAHIQQFSTVEQKLVTDSIAISFRLAKDEPPSPAVRKTRRSKVEKVRSFSDITKSRELPAFRFPNLNPPPLASLPNKRNIIKDWKTKYERFPTYKCYNQMREKYRYFSAIDSEQDTEQVTESFVVTRRSTRRKTELTLEQTDPDSNAEDAKPPATAPNGELLFTDKYKPLLFEQFLVNLSPVSELREFLSNWSVGSSARNSQGLDESIDFDNDSNSNSSQQVSSNTVVLMGPGASGKTSSVFAIANELNLNVLEINAGMKRTGKKLLQELHEATQSHQIRKDTRAQGKAKNNLLKMSLNGLKSKTKSNSQSLDGDASPSSADSSSTTARKCLILIEDADIVFEQMDAGFTDAIYTLAASSKRPVIIVASDTQCSHLQRLMQQNAIYFNEPSTMNISRYMAVLALMENCPVELDDLVSLYIYNKKNLRKTLLELQFFIQSGGDRIGTINASTQSKQKQQPSEQAAFFASPTKRKFAEEVNSLLGTATDDALSKEKSALHSAAQPKLYMHQSLFKFYTTAQNEKWRIPYPLDFNLLRDNLDVILQASPKLSPEAWVATSDSSVSSSAASATTKRKTRSPKKVWLTAAAAQQTMPFEDLGDFYENLSIACMLGARGGDCLLMDRSPHFADRLVPHLAEDIAHELVERAIDFNMEAQPFAYNLNHAAVERQTLMDSLGLNAMRTQRTRALDFEPALRSICRSEKLRATLERRSTRFYHYLRNGAGSSTVHFDDACAVLSNEPAFTDTPAAVEGAVVDSTTCT